MLRLPSCVLLCALAPCAPAIAAAASEPAPVPLDCRTAAAVFEQSTGLPSGLLLAIGQVESGRTDPLTGRADPWPWTTNQGGEGHYFASAQEAIAWVAGQQAAGSQSIDVGCFQVNLHYHPTAFGSLAEAFDPAANARYAASFLWRLHEQTGDWTSAVALYHSADPFEGQRYSSRVMQAWGIGVAGMPAPWVTRTMHAAVTRLPMTAPFVRVVVPDWAAAQVAGPRRDYRAGLPRVVTPGR